MSKSGRIGAAFEVRVADHCATHGFPHCERRVTRGNKDAGDIAGIPGVMIECKAEKRIDLAGYMDEVRVEKANAHAQVGACVIKRRNHSVGKSYVVMELDDFLDLIR